MSSYHCSIKTISRSAGRSVIAAAAYRSGEKLLDDETGMVFDYRKKGGVLSSEIFLPPNAPQAMLNRNALWDAATASEVRKNSTLAREMEVALPAELSASQRSKLLKKLCRELVDKHGFAVDACMHRPHKKHADDMESEDADEVDEKRHAENFHAHILLSTRQLGANGFGKKTREWDEKTSGTVEYWRERVATLTNEALAAAGHETRVDHRSLKDQGITRAPKIRLPRAVFEMNKRGEESDVGEQIQVRKEAEFAKDDIRHERADIAMINGDIDHWMKQLEQANSEKMELEKAEALAMAQVLADAQAVAAAKAQAEAQAAAVKAAAVVAMVPPVTVEIALPIDVYASQTAAELAAVKKRFADDAHQAHQDALKLDAQRAKTQTQADIEAAAARIPVLNAKLEAKNISIVQTRHAINLLDMEYGGLYGMLPDFLSPGRVKLQALLATRTNAGEKLQKDVRQAQKIAGSMSTESINEALQAVKRQRESAIKEVALIESALVRAQERERLDREREKELEQQREYGVLSRNPRKFRRTNLSQIAAL
jgi:hypothetical protein